MSYKRDDANISANLHTPTGGTWLKSVTVADTNKQNRSRFGFGDEISPNEVGTGSNRFLEKGGELVTGIF